MILLEIGNCIIENLNPMKTKKIIALLIISLFSLSVFAGKKSVSFNVMVAEKAKKDVIKKIKKQDGVLSAKSDEKLSAIVVEYDDSKTDINTITNAFKSAGVYACPVGESCANKPGGCLNNKPTTTNTMR